MRYPGNLRIIRKAQIRPTIAAITASLLLFSVLQASESASAVPSAPTCASPWFKDANASNEYAGILVCDYTVAAGTDVTFAMNLPQGVTQVYAVAIGAGGGGGGGGGIAEGQTAGSGGGAGEVILDGQITGLTPASSVTYTVGTGGAGGTVQVGSVATDGGNGGNTTVKVGETVVVIARGGQGGAAGDVENPGSGGASGSGLLGGTGTGPAGGGGGGILAEPYEWPENSGIFYSGIGKNGSFGFGVSTRKGGNGGESQYLSPAPATEYQPITGYYIGQETAETDLLNFNSWTYGGAGGVVGGPCTLAIVDGSGNPVLDGSGEPLMDFYQYGTVGYSYSDGNQFLDSHGACAYVTGGANGRATTGSGIGSGGGGGAGSDTTVSLAGLGSAGNNGALWLRYVQNYSVGDAPSEPGTPTATAGNGSATVTWAESASGTAPITYTVTSAPAGADCVVVGLTATCTGLSNGTSYTFKITATNDFGFAESQYSATVSPRAPRAPAVLPTPPNKYVTFFGNGASGESYKIGSNSPSLLPPNWFREAGYVFTGWNTNPDGSGVTFADGASYSFGSDLQLYAQWVSVKSRKYISTFAGNQALLKSGMKSAIQAWIKKLPVKASIICQGSTSGKKLTTFDKQLANKRAKNVCNYAVKIRPDLTYSITLNPSSASKVAARHVWMIQK